MGDQITIAEFNHAHNRAREQVRKNAGATIESDQRNLRELAERLPAKNHRWASSLIDDLPKAAIPPPPPGPLFMEASAIQGVAFAAQGTTEEKLAIISDAMRQIWEIAERAPAKEAANIRGLSRVLEHLENELRDPTWPEPPAQGS